MDSTVAVLEATTFDGACGGERRDIRFDRSLCLRGMDLEHRPDVVTGLTRDFEIEGYAVVT